MEGKKVLSNKHFYKSLQKIAVLVNFNLEGQKSYFENDHWLQKSTVIKQNVWGIDQ